jgi:RNA polymerase sigma factor (sigma-70 family)
LGQHFSEEQLVQLLRNRDEAGFNELYDKYSSVLLGVIYRMINDRELAEEILQEVFVKIWKSIEFYSEDKGRLYTWMVNITKNLTIDKTRSKSFKNTQKNQSIDNFVTEIEHQRVGSYNPETIGIKDLVSRLKSDHKEVLDLVYFKGYTHQEASEHLEIPLGTVKTKIRMAIKELRKYFNVN